MTKWQEGYSKRHNETRRERYKTDPEYRAVQIERRRSNYRSKVNIKERNVASNDMILFMSLDYNDIFTPKELSEVIGYSVSAIRRWLTNGMLPEMKGGRYTYEEVIAIANCFRDREVSIFSKNDLKLISKINNEVNKVRTQNETTD